MKNNKKYVMRKILFSMLMAAVCGLANAGNVAVGYSDGQLAETGKYSVMGKGTVSAAIRVTPELVSRYVGADVNGVRVGLISTKYCDSLVVWIRETLDGEDIATAVIRRTDAQAPQAGWNDVLFKSSSYKIEEGKEFFVGFSFAQRYRETAVSVVGEPRANTSYLKRGKALDWEDISADGVVSLELLLGGDALPATDLKVASSSAVQQAPGVFNVSTLVTNRARLDVTDYDLTFSADGYSYIFTSDVVVPSGETVVVNTRLESVPAEVGFGNALKVTASRIGNGEDAYPDDNTATVGVSLKRNVVVEEFTGTGCGYCPRGLVGMDKLHDRYGLSFVGIGIHQYNESDPMYPSDYKTLGFSGAPQCLVDRDYFTDPYMGNGSDICDDFEAEMNKGAKLGVDVYAAYNEDRSAVDITASVLAQEAFSGLSVGFVLTADSVTGTTSSWRQSNYYAQYPQNQLPEDMAQFGSGGEKGTSKFDWVYNDVAISTYKEGNNYEMPLADIPQYGSTTVNATLSMPTKAILSNAIKYDQVAANVFVVGSDGKIINAARFYVVDPAGVREMGATSDANAVEVARYTLDGRQIAAPQRGVNIIRLSNGATKKVFVE